MEQSVGPVPTRTYHMGRRLVPTLGCEANLPQIHAHLHKGTDRDRAFTMPASPKEGAVRGIDGDDPAEVAGHAPAIHSTAPVTAPPVAPNVTWEMSGLGLHMMGWDWVGVGATSPTQVLPERVDKRSDPPLIPHNRQVIPPPPTSDAPAAVDCHVPSGRHVMALEEADTNMTSAFLREQFRISEFQHHAILWNRDTSSEEVTIDTGLVACDRTFASGAL